MLNVIIFLLGVLCGGIITLFLQALSFFRKNSFIGVIKTIEKEMTAVNKEKSPENPLVLDEMTIDEEKKINEPGWTEYLKNLSG